MESFTVQCREESAAHTSMRRLFEQRSAPIDIAVQAVLFGALFCPTRRQAIVSNGETPGPDGMVGVRPGELVRVVLVLPRGASVDAYLNKVRWIGAPTVAMKLLQRSSATSMTIRRPDGLDVSIEAVAPEIGACNLRSTWLAGALFDADLLHDAGGISYVDDALRATRARLLPGAIWGVVSIK
jgi:hypothetical protein